MGFQVSDLGAVIIGLGCWWMVLRKPGIELSKCQLRLNTCKKPAFCPWNGYVMCEYRRGLELAELRRKRNSSLDINKVLCLDAI